MCGIVGYIGKEKALNIILDGLSALEYRGYDSAGISVKTEKNTLNTVKNKGKIMDLASLIIEKKEDLNGHIGIGHTRWATHGKPNIVNAHPHFTKRVSVVHNGIIENYRELDEFLKQNKIFKKSETDTETVALLIDFFMNDYPFYEAFEKTIKMLEGSFAIAAISHSEDAIMLAKKDSPLVIGISDYSTYIASDVSAIIKYTKDFIFLEDGDIAKILSDSIEIKDKDFNIIKREAVTVDWSYEFAQKGGFKHFMLKEIAEEDEAVRNTVQSRINSEGKIFLDEEINLSCDFFKEMDSIKIVACGTSYYAGLSAKPIIEKYAKVPVEVCVASEFRYSDPILSKKGLFIVISQSGETADTKESLKYAKSKGIKTLSIVNVKESAIARLADSCIYTLAGPEISVASTKAFVSQLAVLYMLSFYIADIKGYPYADKAKYMLRLPELMKETFLSTNNSVEKIAKNYHTYKNFLFLGRGLLYPIAFEGALKLKEISYIHAEGYPAGEIKHGPIALVDENTPSVIIAHSYEPLYSKILSNAQEIKARSGKIIMFSDKKSSIADEFIGLNEIDYEFSGFIYVIPLQLFAYYIALYLGNDIDQPRNLAKSVTVE